MLQYSAEGLSARPAFYAPYNDVTIIVEDQDDENFYTQVLSRLLQGRFRIEQVLGVGGKRQVIQRFHDRSGKLDWQEFYLVDGDFDELIGRECPDSVYFYRLRQYDIESYLLEEAAICAIAEEESPRSTAAEYQASMQVGRWMTEVVDASIRLVACVALFQELDEQQAGISQTIERYVARDAAFPDKLTIEDHIGRFKAGQSMVEPQDFDRRLEQMLSRMGTSEFDRRRWISGKDILLPLLIRLLHQHTKGRRLNKDSLRFRLAGKCEFTELDELRDRILATVQNSSPSVAS